MFKQTDASNELAELMRQNILSEKAESATHSNKLSRAMECLNNAADLLDGIGMRKAAASVTEVMQDVAKSPQEKLAEALNVRVK